MKISTLILTICFLLVVSGCGNVNKEKIKIKFLLQTSDLPEDSRVYICGSLKSLGNWDPGSTPMKHKGNNLWEKTILIDTGLQIEYKYTLGSWEKEAAGENGLSLSNYIILVTEDTIVKNEILFWTHLTEARFDGQVTGLVDYHKSLKGKGIQDRDIIVWLPPDYDSRPDKKYPVLYMHDGQNLFDPSTSYTHIDWQIDETCDRLIRKGIIPSIIVVGIHNTTDRMEEYLPGEKGTAYMDFVVNIVKPFIDKNYRTLPERENTIVGGSSAGGLVSFMLSWEYPEVFSKAICMSPAFQFGEMDYVWAVEEYSGEKKDLVFYIDNGGMDLDLQLQPGVDAMLEALKKQGFDIDSDLFWILDTNATHNETAWAKRFPNAITLILNTKLQ